MVKTVEKYFYLQETVALLFQGYGNFRTLGYIVSNFLPGSEYISTLNVERAQRDATFILVLIILKATNLIKLFNLNFY